MPAMDIVMYHSLRAEVCEMRFEELLDMFNSKKVDAGHLRALVWQLQSTINKSIIEERKQNAVVRTYSYYRIKKHAALLEAHCLLALL